MGFVRGVFRNAFQKFHSELEKRPLRTQMIAGGSLTFLGDVIAQQGIEKRTLEEHDWTRSCRMGFFAIVVWTGVGYKWSVTDWNQETLFELQAWGNPIMETQ